MDQRLRPVRPGVPHRRLSPLPQAAPGVIAESFDTRGVRLAADDARVGEERGHPTGVGGLVTG
jgi:hypothetical protein